MSTNFRLAYLFGLSEEPFLRVTEEVLEAMIAKIPEIIKWPEENELNLYAEEYNTIGRYLLLQPPNCLAQSHVLKLIFSVSTSILLADVDG